MRPTFSARPRLEQLAHWCIETALRDAGFLGLTSRGSRRAGARHRRGVDVALGSRQLRGRLAALRPGPRPRSTVERVRRELDLCGPALALSAACASGNHALEIGRQWLRLGLVDFCVAGACDLAVSPIGLATFGNLRALARNADPSAASRPFDRGRDGFVLGEGGVAFVLERATDARRRRPTPTPRLPAAAPAATPTTTSSPAPTPPRPPPPCARPWPTRVSSRGQVDHVNAHATSTPVGDAAEAAVLRLVLGDDADRIPVSSTKSLTGHMLTAAGAFEALACLTALRHQAIPPTINLDDPDVDLCLVANEARPHPVRIAVSNSFGFGGSNTSLVLRRVNVQRSSISQSRRGPRGSFVGTAGGKKPSSRGDRHRCVERHRPCMLLFDWRPQAITSGDRWRGEQN